jgi:predicted Fe-Mo cluster-binding NifX family protein
VRTDDLSKAHAVSRRIEDNIREQVSHVEGITIHYQPQSQEHIRIAVPLRKDRNTVNDHFGESPYFAVAIVRRTDNRVGEMDIFENPHQAVTRAKGIRVAEWLVDKNVDRVLVKEELKHKGPGYVFANAGVTVTPVHAARLDEALDNVFGDSGGERTESQSF